VKLKEITDYREIYENSDLARLLGLALNSPTPGKVRSAAQGAYSKQQGHFFAVLGEDGSPIGIAGYRTVDNNKMILLHVAVDPAHRGQGVGRRMVETLRSFLKSGAVMAEVSPAQSGFLEALGFQCKPGGDPEVDDSLVLCTWRVPEQR